MYALHDTTVLNDFLTSAVCKFVIEKIEQSLFAYYMYRLNSNLLEERRQQDARKLEEMRQRMDEYGYSLVENDLISQVRMENAIGLLNDYLRKFPKLLYEENMGKNY